MRGFIRISKRIMDGDVMAELDTGKGKRLAIADALFDDLSH